MRCAFSSAGIHPHDAKSWTEGYLEDLREMATSPECVAVGECGLDYNRDFSPVDIQKKVFEKQVCAGFLLSSRTSPFLPSSLVHCLLFNIVSSALEDKPAKSRKKVT